jgi:error-prone DNA polymerase
VDARARNKHRRFERIDEVRRLALRKNELEALASADAFHSLGGDRYRTRWQLMDSEAELPLFCDSSDVAKSSDATNAHKESPPAMRVAESPAVFIRAPGETDNLLEDYAALGLTLNRHPIQLLEDAGTLGDYTPASELKMLAHKSLVTVVGVVTGRQSPGTASGVTFITLEDHTGNSNVVVWLATARAQHRAYLTSRLLKVRGILEREGEVVHVIAGRLTDMSQHLDTLCASSRDFH